MRLGEWEELEAGENQMFLHSILCLMSVMELIVLAVPDAEALHKVVFNLFTGYIQLWCATYIRNMNLFTIGGIKFIFYCIL